MSLTKVEDAIGAVVKYNFALEREYDLFKMTSHYYRCEVQAGFGAQKLDGYEQALGFVPVWVEMDAAIQRNRRLLTSVPAPGWLPRETFVLEYLEQNL